MSFGETIKILRKEKCMTQDELGEILGVKKAAIQKIESGQVQSLKISNIKTICDLFNISPNELLYEKEEMLRKEVEVLNNIELLFGRESVEVLRFFTLLNEKGQSKVIDYVIDLSNLNYYTK